MSSVPAPPPSGGVLRIQAFRRLWIGLGLSSLGDWLGLLALTSMAATLAPDTYADKNFAIAGVLLLRVVPALVIGPVAGWVADRLDRRWTLIIGDILRGAVFVTIPIVHTLAWVMIATVIIEAISLVWLPAKDATVPNLVPRDRLESANQISITTTYGSALPAAGVFVLLSLGTKSLHASLGLWESTPVTLSLYFNAASFVVSGLVIATLHQIPKGPAVGMEQQSAWRIVSEGWAFIARQPMIRGLVVGIVGAFAGGGVVIGLARTYVQDLGGGNPGYGVLFAAVFAGLALGMWRGSGFLAGMSRRRLFGFSLVVSGIVLAGIAAIANLVVVTVLTVVMGFFAGAAWITGYTLIGLEVDDAIRGRTFAFVQTMIRMCLALVLALAPILAGVIGRHRWRISDDAVLDYNGASITIFAAALVVITVGVVAYHHMNDRPGISIRTELRQSVMKGNHDSAPVYAEQGLFVAFEGGEGSGKSTQARLLADWVEAEGYNVVRTHEPGASGVGQRLRAVLLDPETGSLDYRAEALLYAADKAEHVRKLIWPALDRGDVVVTDRYVDSTLAYQGAGRSLPPQEVERIARWATEDLRPHLTVLLDVDPEVGLTRLGSPDRLEAEPLAFHQRIRQCYLEMARADPEHYLVIDAGLGQQEIAGSVRARVQGLLRPTGRPHGATA